MDLNKKNVGISVPLLLISIAYLYYIFSGDSIHSNNLSTGVASEIIDHNPWVHLQFLLLFFTGSVAAVFALLSVSSWRLLTGITIVLYFYFVWGPNFFAVILEHGMEATINAIIEKAKVSESYYSSFVYNVFLPVTYIFLLLNLVIYRPDVRLDADSYHRPAPKKSQ